MYDDKLGALEKSYTYRTSAGGNRIELDVVSSQRNDFGFQCVPTSSAIVITAYFTDYTVKKTDLDIGVLGNSSQVIQVSSSILPLAKVTASDSKMIQLTLSPAGREFEHTEFTVLFSPPKTGNKIDTDYDESITLRYNTPPAAPLGVVVDDEGNFSLAIDAVWDVVSGTGNAGRDGYIFWAWPQGMTSAIHRNKKLADCISTFVVNGRAYTPVECAVGETLQGEDDVLYDIYRLQVSGKRVELYARDEESIRSPAIVSGSKPHVIDIDVGAGTFAGGEGYKELYKQPSSELSLSELPQPVWEGYSFAGWAFEPTGAPIAFPIVVERDIALFALWQEPSSEGEVRNLEGVYNFDSGVITISWDFPYVYDIDQFKVTLEGEEISQELVVEGSLDEAVFSGIQNDTNEYVALVQLVDSQGNESDGLMVSVSTNTEFYDEIGNLQAIVLSSGVDFKWTSPLKEDVSHIIVTCYGNAGDALDEPVIVERDKQSASMEIMEGWPRKFVFQTVDFQGNVSEGMTMYTIDLEIDGDSDSIDHRLVIPANMSLESSPSYYLLDTPAREGYAFDGWYTDASFEEPCNLSAPVIEAFCLFAKWVTPDEENRSLATEAD